ncbi:cytochrome P450 [Mycena rosella]|uniref:Cytochrome P450 n=1 Tax=Mycena rosella TaxID=1033263 RepID=A0AAD7DL76_MYCRO|nr:cytochrome P450 [Mycena rosella]
MIIPLLLFLLPLALIWVVRNRRWASNIDGPPPESVLLGPREPSKDDGATTGRDWQVDTVNQYGGVVKIKSLFNRPALLVSDPMSLHHILVKEPTVFAEWPPFTITSILRRCYISTTSLLFGEGLTATIGEKHRKQRKMLNPVFSWKNIREMAPRFFVVAKELKQSIQAKLDDGSQEIEMTTCLTHTALELIGQNGLGHSFSSSDSSHQALAKAVKELVATLSVLVPGAPFLPFFVRLGSASLRRRIIQTMPFSTIQELQYIVDTMASHMVQLFHEKKAKLLEATDETEQHDIMAILFKANKNSSASERLGDEELLGQMATFMFTATDTTSGALSRLFHLLAQHPEVQDKLFEEIAGQGEEPDCDILARFHTWTLFPPIPMVWRQTTEDTSLPLLHPVRGTDGRNLSSVEVPKGTDIFISILGANHHRPTWGKDASEWKPDRWLSPLPANVISNRSIAGAMTFSSGRRACIGFTFALLEMKVVLFCLLRSFEFTLVPNKEIGWNMGLFMTPVLKSSDSIHSHMPLRVKKRGIYGHK